MFGLTTLRNAILRLAGSLNGLADTCDTINHGVRQQALLDGPAPLPVNALPAPALAPAEVPIAASTVASGATQSEGDPSAASTPRNGRKRPAPAG
jgi:hypothetical protein